jgi:hypothetical protein
MNKWESTQLPGELRDLADHLRENRHESTPLELDELKRRALARSAPASRQGKGLALKSRLVTLLLVLGLAVSAGSAGVIAGHDPSGHPSAGHGQYCNSGNGNGPEFGDPPGNPQGNTGDQTSPDCDPGNSPTHNNDNEKEGPGPGQRPPTPRNKK